MIFQFDENGSLVTLFMGSDFVGICWIVLYVLHLRRYEWLDDVLNVVVLVGVIWIPTGLYGFIALSVSTIVFAGVDAAVSFTSRIDTSNDLASLIARWAVAKWAVAGWAAARLRGEPSKSDAAGPSDAFDAVDTLDGDACREIIRCVVCMDRQRSVVFATCGHLMCSTPHSCGRQSITSTRPGRTPNSCGRQSVLGWATFMQKAQMLRTIRPSSLLLKWTSTRCVKKSIHTLHKGITSRLPCHTPVGPPSHHSCLANLVHPLDLKDAPQTSEGGNRGGIGRCCALCMRQSHRAFF
eukprot:scaffold14532_cov101-Isochrysis_galbana.AAC.1